MSSCLTVLFRFLACTLLSPFRCLPFFLHRPEPGALTVAAASCTPDSLVAAFTSSDCAATTVVADSELEEPAEEGVAGDAGNEEEGGGTRDCVDG
jgi:hypothetical protein